MTVYNKIFTKILDSSIWLESATTRLVWLTFIAAMDEEGFVQFASVANLAHRARVTMDEAQAAVDCLESPDLDSSDPENEGRRIEKVPGGWMVLNSHKYRALVTRTICKEQTRIRVARHREKKKGNVTCNAQVTTEKREVTQSDTDTDTKSEAKREEERSRAVKSASTNVNDPEDEVDIRRAPTEKEFIAECERYSVPAFYARDKWLAQDSKGWEKLPKWRSHVKRVAEWYANDGRPTSPKNGNGTPKPDPMKGIKMV